MVLTRLFLSNTTQAVRLPREVAFPPGVSEVRVIREGAHRVIAPADGAWDSFFDEAGAEMPDRAQPEMQARESF